MKSLLLSLVLALLGGVVAYAGLARAVPPREMVSVVVAARAVPAGHHLVAADLDTREVDARSAAADAIHDVEEVTGRYTTAPLSAGDAVTGTRVSDRAPGSTLAAQVPKGCVAVSVAVSDEISGGGLIAPGDRVDVLGVVSKEATETAELVLRDVTLLAVASDIIGSDAAAGGASTQRSSRVNPTSLSATVTLAMNVAEAQRLVQVDEIGTLRLVLRSASDTTTSNEARCLAGTQ